jgi:hypothetical protein
MGFDGVLEMDENTTSSEDAELDFNARLSSYLPSSFKNIKLIGSRLAPASPMGIKKLGDFDVLGHMSDNGNEVVFFMENKFGKWDNIRNDEYVKFVDKHYWLSKILAEFGYKSRVVSIWFSPYKKDEGVFFEKLNDLLTDNKEIHKGYEEIIFFHKSLREKNIIPCFGEFESPDVLKECFASEEWQSRIDKHLDNLSKVLSGLT